MFSFSHQHHQNLSDRELIIKVLDNQNHILMTLADIQTKNAALIAAVKDEDTVIDSAVTLITGLAQQLTVIKTELDAALAANDPVALQQVADSMDATISDVNTKKASLASAVEANTAPAVPAQTPAPEAPVTPAVA